MPEFANPFAGNTSKKLTEQELIRSIRFMIAKEVLVDIANEERVHAGEFLRLLKQLAPEEVEYYKQGAKEVEEEIEKQRKENKWILIR